MNPFGANAHSRRRMPTAFQLTVAVSLLTLGAAWAASGTAQSAEKAEKEEREVQDKIPAHPSVGPLVRPTTETGKRIT